MITNADTLIAIIHPTIFDTGEEFKSEVLEEYHFADDVDFYSWPESTTTPDSFICPARCCAFEFKASTNETRDEHDLFSGDVLAKTIQAVNEYLADYEAKLKAPTGVYWSMLNMAVLIRLDFIEIDTYEDGIDYDEEYTFLGVIDAEKLFNQPNPAEIESIWVDITRAASAVSIPLPAKAGSLLERSL